MLLFGHVGISVATAERYLPVNGETFRAMACVAFCAVLPDLLDKPIRFLGWTSEPSGRLWGHTLLFSLAWCGVCATRLRVFWPWALATPGHLVLDWMFTQPRTLFWPLLGFGFDVPERVFTGPIENWLWRLDHEPESFALSVLLPELVGLLLFISTLRRGRSRKRKEALLLHKVATPSDGASPVGKPRPKSRA